MKIKNIKEGNCFTSVDSCKITELFGLPTCNLKEVSLAYAILPGKSRTLEHLHEFLEIYTILLGEGIMHINSKQKRVVAGDSVLIPVGSNHYIKNTNSRDLEFYCICAPAFTKDGTVMKK